MKKILIPVDSETNSLDAVDYAIDFFKSEACHFYFINIYHYEVGGLNKVDLLKANAIWFKKPERDSRLCLKEITQKYEQNQIDSRHTFTAFSEYAHLLVDGIKKAVEEKCIDLVLIPAKKNAKTKGCGYSKNTKRLIEAIRECPIMIIPQKTKINKHPEFALVSNFEIELPKPEIENWVEIVKAVKGHIKLITLTNKKKMTSRQINIHEQLQTQLETLTLSSITTEYFNPADNLKEFANMYSESIICLIDKKPDFLRKYGFSKSRIIDLGPLEFTPLIALHP